MDRTDKRPADPVDLIGEHYEMAEMPDEYRRTLLTKSRNVVAARRKSPVIRWAACLAGTAAVVAVLMVMANHRPTPEHPTKPAVVIGPSKTNNPKPDQDAAAVNLDKQPSRDLPLDTSHTKTDPDSRTPGAPYTAQQPTPGKAPSERLPETPKPSGSPILAIVSVTQPATDATGRTIAAGDRFPAGRPIRTGRGGRLSFVTRKGSELHLDSNSELVMSASAVATISRGRLYCRNRNHEIARIDTPAGHVKLLGTVVDTAVLGKDAVAVTVVEGKVQLSNRRGAALVDAGQKSVLVASHTPEPGRPVDAYRETAWYHGRRDYQSDFGDIAYVVSRGNGRISEIWTAKTDGSDRHRVRSYLGRIRPTGEWLPGKHLLMLQTDSLVWGRPDIKNRIADKQRAGSPIVKSRIWLLNVLTGQDMPIGLPDGYAPFCMSLSPDARLVALSGSYNPEPGNRDRCEDGIWVYNTETGDLSRVFGCDLMTTIAWAPDSRRLVVSPSSDGVDYDLTIIDTKTKEAHSLGISGADAKFSPDGTKLAYCGDFKISNHWLGGPMPTTGHILVLDLTKDGEPLRISSSQDYATAPCWSPDGSRIAYIKSRTDLCVVNADGTGLREIYHADPDTLIADSWVPKGDAIYARSINSKTSSGQTVLVAADGSGVIATIDGSGQENRLSPKSEAQTEAAASAIGEAIFQWAMGPTYTFEADLGKQHACYHTAAGIFGELLWDYPLSGLSPENIDDYVKAAGRMAAVPDEQILHDSCEQRMHSLAGRVIPTIFAHRQFAPDLDTLINWGRPVKMGTNGVNMDSDELLRMHRECPGTAGHGPTAYIYTPPAEGSEPKIGDVLIRCPLHPDVCFTWGEMQNLCLHHSVVSEAAPGSRTSVQDSPYSFENIGTEPLTVFYHVLPNTYEVRGTAKLLPSRKTYSNETIRLEDCEAK